VLYIRDRNLILKRRYIVMIYISYNPDITISTKPGRVLRITHIPFNKVSEATFKGSVVVDVDEIYLRDSDKLMIILDKYVMVIQPTFPEPFPSAPAAMTVTTSYNLPVYRGVNIY
jgi:hypothetical protein